MFPNPDFTARGGQVGSVGTTIFPSIGNLPLAPPDGQPCLVLSIGKGI